MDRQSKQHLMPKASDGTQLTHVLGPLPWDDAIVVRFRPH